MRRSTCLAATQDKSRMSVHLLIKPTTYQLGVVCFFLSSFLALCVQGPVSDFTQGTAQVVNQQSFLFSKCGFVSPMIRNGSRYNDHPVNKTKGLPWSLDSCVSWDGVVKVINKCITIKSASQSITHLVISAMKKNKTK